VSTIRFKHFHHINWKKPASHRKGGLAATIAYQDSLIDRCVDIGFSVANPNDDGLRKPSEKTDTFVDGAGVEHTKTLTETTRISKQEGRERALEMLKHEPVTITQDSFERLKSYSMLYEFLCHATLKPLKVTSRSVE
jgi:hypothetical protein